MRINTQDEKIKFVNVYNITNWRLFCVFLFLNLIIATACPAGTSVRDSSVLLVSEYIWLNEFEEALEISGEMTADEPDNPIGYFLMGATYLTISEKFRNDNYKDEIVFNLDRAIELSDRKIESDETNPHYYFIKGASYGYRGVHRAFHGGWWGAFRDGMRCQSQLHQTLKYDSLYYDAYFALGSYHYYKTIKARDFLWLPFISDRREEGMREIATAIKNGHLTRNLARLAFLRIYFFEERFEDLILLADSLNEMVPNDPLTLLYHTEALLALDSLGRAEETLERLRLVWKRSPYYDKLGAIEAELLLAKIAFRDGDLDLARRITDEILSREKDCDLNAYFEETYDKTRIFEKSLR